MNSSYPQPCMGDVKCENCMTIHGKNPQDTLNFEYLSMMLSTKNFFGHIKNYFSLNLSSGIFELRKRRQKM